MKERCCYLSLLIAVVMAIAFSAWNATAAGPEGLVLYLSFDEKDPVVHSPNPADVSVLKGALKLVDGKFGKAAEFDGSTYIKVADADKLDGMKALTIEVWINPDKTTDGGIVSKRVTYQGEDAYNLFLYTGSKMSGRIDSSADFWSQTVFNTGKWYHVAYVFDGKSNQQRMYVNGALDAEGVQAKQEVPERNSSLWVGELDDGRGFIYSGVMDELGLWNRALSEDEIKLVMTVGKKMMMPVEFQGKLTTTWGELKGR